MQYTNHQILAAVVSTWVRPAVTQIAFSKVANMPSLQSLQGWIVNSGLVNSNYNLAHDLEPMMQPVMDALVNPFLERYFANIPDEAIPLLAHNIVEKMKERGTYGILDNLIVFDEADILELENLLLKNLPVQEGSGYCVKS